MTDYFYMSRKENADWLYEKLNHLTELSEKLSHDETVTKYSYHTAMKLIAVDYYAGIFTKIVKGSEQQKWFDGAVYVDLFAGTGLVKLKDSKYNDFLPGSPICAGIHNFDYLVCVEINKKQCNALEKRLSEILSRDKFCIIHGDCNNKISEVINIIKKHFKKPILFTFVDPEGLAIKFSTLKTLNESFKNCDFIVNVNAQGVKRVSGKYQKGSNDLKNSLEAYFDMDVNIILEKSASKQEPEEQYATRIKQLLKKNMGDTIKIHDEGARIAYYLLGYTRKTKKGSKYAKAFTDLQRRLDWVNNKQIRRQIEKIHKRQSKLNDFD